jgi:hypothetical protein
MKKYKVTLVNKLVYTTIVEAKDKQEALLKAKLKCYGKRPKERYLVDVKMEKIK